MQWIQWGCALRFISSAPSFVKMVLCVWLCADDFSPYMGRRTSSSMSLNNGTASPWEEPSGSQSVPQRKKLLKAPSLAELDSSDSDVSMTLYFHDGSRHDTSGMCSVNESNSSIFYIGWLCWAQINKQLQCCYVFDGWHVSRVCSWKEK